MTLLCAAGAGVARALAGAGALKALVTYDLSGVTGEAASLEPVAGLSTAVGAQALRVVQGGGCEAQPFEGVAGLRFTDGEGVYIPNLPGIGLTPGGAFTVSVTFKWDAGSPASWKRVLNTHQGRDQGIYVRNNCVQPYPQGCEMTFTSDKYYTMVIKKASGNGPLIISVQAGETGAAFQEHTWPGPPSETRLVNADNMLFFNDRTVDICGDGGEHANGHLKAIQVWDRVLSSAETQAVAAGDWTVSSTRTNTATRAFTSTISATTATDTENQYLGRIPDKY